MSGLEAQEKVENISVAIIANDYEAFTLLLGDPDLPKFINQRNIGGKTLLSVAALKNRSKMLTQLLDKRADMSIGDSKGDSQDATTLMHAVCYSSSVIAHQLIDHPSCSREILNAKTSSFGLSALHIAIQQNRLDVIKALVRKGAKADITQEHRGYITTVQEQAKLCIDDKALRKEVIDFLKAETIKQKPWRRRRFATALFVGVGAEEKREREAPWPFQQYKGDKNPLTDKKRGVELGCSMM